MITARLRQNLICSILRKKFKKQLFHCKPLSLQRISDVAWKNYVKNSRCLRTFFLIFLKMNCFANVFTMGNTNVIAPLMSIIRHRNHILELWDVSLLSIFNSIELKTSFCYHSNIASQSPEIQLAKYVSLPLIRSWNWVESLPRPVCFCFSEIHNTSNTTLNMAFILSIEFEVYFGKLLTSRILPFSKVSSLVNGCCVTRDGRGEKQSLFISWVF